MKKLRHRERKDLFQVTGWARFCPVATLQCAQLSEPFLLLPYLRNTLPSSVRLGTRELGMSLFLGQILVISACSETLRGGWPAHIKPGVLMHNYNARIWKSEVGKSWVSSENSPQIDSYFVFYLPVVSRLPDGLTRRGDINLLMLGDPGTAKSQLLKFVEKCSPIGVSVWEQLVKWLRCPSREEGFRVELSSSSMCMGSDSPDPLPRSSWLWSGWQRGFGKECECV